MLFYRQQIARIFWYNWNRYDEMKFSNSEIELAIYKFILNFIFNYLYDITTPIMNINIKALRDAYKH